MNWECISSRTSNGGGTGKSAARSVTSQEITRFKRALSGSRSTSLTLQRQAHASWQHIVQTYSRRELTNEADKLMAVMGVARFIGEVTGDRFLAGLWRDQLWRDLLWRLDASSYGGSLPSRIRSVHFPSWSWASVGGPVEYKWPAGSSPGSMVSMLQLMSTNVDSDMSRGDVRGRLKLSAQLRKMIFRGERPDRLFHDKSVEFYLAEQMSGTQAVEEWNNGELDEIEAARNAVIVACSEAFWPDAAGERLTEEVWLLPVASEQYWIHCLALVDTGNRGRVPTGPWSTLQAQARSFSSTKGSSSASTFSKATRYTAIASVAIGAPCLWWLLNPSTRDQVPRLESPPTEHLTIEPGPSKDDVTRILSQEAYSLQVRSVAGVSRYDGTRIPSNCPCEDQFIHGTFPSPWNDGQQWIAWGVFDGHAGWQTADLLTKQLLPFVRHCLGQLIPAASEEKGIPDEAIQHAIKKGFMTLDDLIIKTGADVTQSEEPLQDKLKKLAVAYAGSCALLSIYDPVTCNLHVACTGDSRAVLGQKTDGKWEAIPLSVDQTGDNKEEIARLNKEHPGEENIVKGGRVLGMMVSRAFGDARWKWPLELQKSFIRRFYGTSPLTPTEHFQTPPYLTAEPVVTTTKIDPSKPSFLILASDGLWYTLSSEQAVDLVGQWVESSPEERRNSMLLEPTYEPFDFSHFWKGVRWRFAKERTTVQDDNVAVHLVRNALGGDHHELVAGRLAFSPPAARRVRDDITVQVVLFKSQP
ncbi:hypothetical protein ONZ43_g6932 [Nemania bipapillata]|uniref:Uncharacterized protein n=1 Tax=Nemania bipapillata TaxID=110536 RepID=A0ACC2HV96_9PEZI|nr:hypothetical protein ONZ43_g6932 [Nemania bipapillata]